MSLSLHRLTAAAAARQILARQFTAGELARDCVGRIAQLEPELHAWAYFDPENFIERAKGVDRRLAGGEVLGALAGIPVGVKDIFNTADMPTAMGSPLWDGFTPGNDARAVFNLKRADAVMAGKTVTAEFAVHAPGPTKNPLDTSRIPGTSSSGSAVAVAAEMVPCAIGTQTAGSVIRPASYCGIYGYKPSFGLIPRTGMLKTTDPLDTVGFFSRSAEDLGILLEALRVHGLDYPISHQKLSDSEFSQKRGGKWRVALLRHPKWALAEPYARQAIEQFTTGLARENDIELSEPELPEALAEAHDVHATIYDKSIAYYFKNEFREHTLISREIKEMIERGNAVPLERFRRALERQAQIASETDRFLADYDACFTLSTAGEAPEIGSPEKEDSCLIWTLCGLPAIGVPLLTGPSGLPMGVQTIARRYADRRLLTFVERLAARAPSAQPQPKEVLR